MFDIRKNKRRRLKAWLPKRRRFVINEWKPASQALTEINWCARNILICAKISIFLADWWERWDLLIEFWITPTLETDKWFALVSSRFCCKYKQRFYKNVFLNYAFLTTFFQKYPITSNSPVTKQTKCGSMMLCFFAKNKSISRLEQLRNGAISDKSSICASFSSNHVVSRITCLRMMASNFRNTLSIFLLLHQTFFYHR